MRRQHRSAFISLLAALLLAFIAAGPAEAARKPRAMATAYPTSMSSLGDSITRGFNASGWFSDWPSRSWSTGSYSTVKSHATRLSAYSGAMRVYNNARSGAKVGELAGQAATTVSQGTEYATVLIGANDACTETEGQMTPVADFATRFENAMDTFAGDPTPPKVLVASIPDIHRLYSVGKGSSSARNAWAAYGICQSMLANPQSTNQADVDRRQRVRQRVIDYNAKLQSICVSYTFCRYDGGAVFNYQFTLSQLSTWDYFHPNTAGQTVLAAETWKAGFWPTS